MYTCRGGQGSASVVGLRNLDHEQQQAQSNSLFGQLLFREAQQIKHARCADMYIQTQRSRLAGDRLIILDCIHTRPCCFNVVFLSTPRLERTTMSAARTRPFVRLTRDFDRPLGIVLLEDLHGLLVIRATEALERAHRRASSRPCRRTHHRIPVHGDRPRLRVHPDASAAFAIQRELLVIDLILQQVEHVG